MSFAARVALVVSIAACSSFEAESGPGASSSSGGSSNEGGASSSSSSGSTSGSTGGDASVDGATACFACSGIVCDDFERDTPDPLASGWSGAFVGGVGRDGNYAMRDEGTSCSARFRVHVGSPSGAFAARLMRRRIDLSKFRIELDLQVGPSKKGKSVFVVVSPDGDLTAQSPHYALMAMAGVVGFGDANPAQFTNLTIASDERVRVVWNVDTTGTNSVTVGGGAPQTAGFPKLGDGSSYYLYIGVGHYAGAGDSEAFFDNLRVSAP